MNKILICLITWLLFTSCGNKTTLNNGKPKFRHYVFATQNIEEDTLTYRSIAEIDTFLLPAINKIKTEYLNKNYLSGNFCFNLYINCAGDIIKIGFNCNSTLKDTELIKYSLNKINTIKIRDNLGTNRCGEIVSEIDLIFE